MTSVNRLVDYFVVVELQPAPNGGGRSASGTSLLSDTSAGATTNASEEEEEEEEGFSELEALSAGSDAAGSAASSSSSSPSPLRYAPVVVDRYPPRDYKNKPLEPFTANFALPVDDAPLAFSDDRRRSIYTFVLTNSARELTFGTTLRFCEATPDPSVFMPKALCVLSAHAWLAPLFEGFLLNLHNLTMFRVLTLPLEVYVQHFVEHASLPRPGSTLRFHSDATFVIEDQAGNVVSRQVSPARSRASSQSNMGVTATATATATADNNNDNNRSSPSTYSPSGISPTSSPTTSISDPSTITSAATTSAATTSNNALDATGGGTGFLGLDALAYHRAPSNTLDAVRGCVDAHFETLVSCLDASNVLLVLNAMVLDSKLMFHSRHVDRLTASLEALCTLLFPFDWHHVYVPITPDHPDFLQMLDEEIIMPFMFGLHSETFARVLKTSSGLSEVFIIDLDNNRVHVPPSAMQEGGGMTGMSEPFVPMPRHLVLRALEGIQRIVPPRLAARAAPGAWGGDQPGAAFIHPGETTAAAGGSLSSSSSSSSSGLHEVQWHFRPADKGERILDPWTVKQAAAVAAAAQAKQKKAVAEKKAADAAEKSLHDHHNKGHNPLNWLFNKRSKKNVAAHAEQKNGGGGGSGGSGGGGGNGGSAAIGSGASAPGSMPDDSSPQAGGARSGTSSGASSVNGDFDDGGDAIAARTATHKSLVDADLEDSLLDLFSLWFTGRHAGALAMDDAQLTGQDTTGSVGGGTKGAFGLGLGGGDGQVSTISGAVDSTARPSFSWVDVLRCAVLEIFMAILKDLPRYTYVVPKKMKMEKKPQDHKKKSNRELERVAAEEDRKEAYVFPENELASADSSSSSSSSSSSRRGKLDMDDFLDSIDVSESRAFVRSLRSTQLWQQFQETWVNGIVNPDMTLFRECIARYVSGNEARTAAAEKEHPNHDPRALVTRNYQARWEELATTWWRQLCYERKVDDMKKSNGGGMKTQPTLSALSSTSLQPTPVFHVYAESVFPRFEPDMFESTQLSGRSVTVKQSKKVKRGSVKTAAMKINLDDIRPKNAADSQDYTDADATAHTPLRKRRVSISAMTALRFSMQEEQQQEEQQHQHQRNRQHHLQVGGSSRHGVIGRVVGNLDVDAPRGGQRLSGGTSRGNMFQQSVGGGKDSDVMGAGLFVPAGAQTDIRLRSTLRRQPGTDAAKSSNILDDVRRLIAQTPGGGGGGAMEKERIRRRLVDDLFAMRVGGDGGRGGRGGGEGGGGDPVYSSPSSHIEF